MKKIYGYCRISQRKQSIERQIRNIKARYPDAIIIQEAYTGTKFDGRKAYEYLLKQIRKEIADGVEVLLVFDSVSRMSRNAEDGFNTYEELYNRGINLVFLKEPHINTDTYKKSLTGLVSMTNTNVDFILEGINKYLLALAKEQIRLAFEQAEKEVEDLHQRTKEGIETAKLAGKQIGKSKGDTWETKKSKEVKQIILKHSKDFNGTLADVDVMKLAGVARKTYYKYKKELRETEA